MYYFINVNSF